MKYLPPNFATMVLGVLSWVGFQDSSVHADACPEVLFNGEDLTGWTVVGSAVWRAESDVLHGGQDGDPSRWGLIMTQESFQDFDLNLEFKIDEHGKYNSGVYLRHGSGESRRRGYQVNIGRGAADEPVGLYLDEWLDKGDAKDKYRRVLEWNHLRIRAVGPHIETWLNGTKIVDFTDSNPDPELLKAGAIAFQTYGAEGHDGWVQFRNMRIVDLSKKAE